MSSSARHGAVDTSNGRRPQLYGSLITFLVINNVVIASRVYVHVRTHHITRRKILLEDIFALLSAICVNVVIANLLVSTHHGLGLHGTTINAQDPHMPRNISNVFKHVWITMVLQGPTFTFIKLSLLFLYRRLFLVNQRWLYIAWWTNLVYVILWAFGATGFYLFQCWPVGWYWLRYYQKFDPTYTKTGQCDATTVQHVAMPLIFGLISDVALLFLPLTAILRLQITKQKKLGLAGIFGVGVLACLLELARIVELEVDTDDKTDPSYGVVIFLILSAAEEVCTIICSSLPVVVPLLYQQYQNRHASTPSFSNSHSARKGDLNSFSHLGYNSKLSTVVPSGSRIGRKGGFGKLDEDNESSLELRSHGAGNHDVLVSTNGDGEAWPMPDNAIGIPMPSYSVTAATPANHEGVQGNEMDIVVRKEVRVTTEGANDGYGQRDG